MASAHAAITTPEVPNQNSNEQQKFCFTPEEFHKLMALANSVQPNSSNQNNVQPAVNLVSTSHFSGKVQPTLKQKNFFLVILLLLSQIPLNIGFLIWVQQTI